MYKALLLTALVLTACASRRVPVWDPQPPPDVQYSGNMCFQDRAGLLYLARGAFRYDADRNQVEFTELSIQPVQSCVVLH